MRRWLKDFYIFLNSLNKLDPSQNKYQCNLASSRYF